MKEDSFPSDELKSNLLTGGYIGDYIGDYYSGYKGNARGFDYTCPQCFQNQANLPVGSRRVGTLEGDLRRPPQS